MNGRPRPLVVVDPGHGGPDPGAVNELLALRESDINLSLALEFLRVSSGAPYDVRLLRVTDASLSLADRARLANEAGVAALLSFHANAASEPGAEGFEVWTSRGETPADRLSTLIFTEFLLGTMLVGREDKDDGDPDKEADFYVLRASSMPAVLIEFGFITNEGDAEALSDPDARAEMVQAVRNALETWIKERQS